MKLLLYIFISSAICLASCSKENIAIQPENGSSLNPDMAYLHVTVSTENEAALNGGCMGNERCILAVEDALVIVYLADGERRPPEATVVTEGSTDQDGLVNFAELELREYMIEVTSEFGERTVKVNPVKGRYTQVIVRL